MKMHTTSGKPTPEEDPLLSPNSKNSSTWCRPFTTILIACMSLVAFVACAFFFFSASVSSDCQAVESIARPQKKLKQPVVLLISSDGFRFGYQHKTATPNIHRLIAEGTEAETGLIPVFPTLTFPNHYSIVTGLYPVHHGIINNYFVDHTGATFTTRSHDPYWWLGEPIWQTAVKQGLKAATYFWPGSEVKKGGWDCPRKFCPAFNSSVPFEDRVNTVLSYFDLPSDEIPSFINLYFQDPDSQGHKFGPDDPRITEAIAHVDTAIGMLIDGLEKRGIFDDVHIIMVGDHGMVGTCDRKIIFLDDFKPWIPIPWAWVQYDYPVLSVRPPADVSPSDVVARMREGLDSGKIRNGLYLKMYLKEELPERLHYSDSDRIPPVIGLADEGFKIEQNDTKKQECAGAHGYDNAIFSMRTIFIGHGPRFPRGRKVPSFENVEIYNTITSILGIESAPNNGTASFANSILLRSP